MAGIFAYDTIVKYKICAECTEPFHTGSADGAYGQILIHPADGVPFIQASSIAGAFRDYYEKINGKLKTCMLFGESMDMDNADKPETKGGNDRENEENRSRIRITDGVFLPKENGQMVELRPRIKIDQENGSVAVNNVQGTMHTSGQKFEMEYIGACTQIEFYVYLYADSTKENILDTEKSLKQIFGAIQSRQLQFGGQKSNGCGYLSIQNLLYQKFNMKDAQDRELWSREDKMEDSPYTKDLLKDEELSSLEHSILAYQLTLSGSTEGEILVKSICVPASGKSSPDCANMQNAKKEYIIPGSSMKGVMRNQMDQIAAYLETSDIINDTFGVQDDKEKNGYTGNIRFFDTKIENPSIQETNTHTAHRIHIDKFTSGVIHGSLFTEESVYGNISIRINILDKNKPDRTLGLLILALRDLAAGMVGIGSGNSIGRGFIKAGTLEIIDKKNKDHTAQILFKENKIIDEYNIIKNCLCAVRGN